MGKAFLGVGLKALQVTHSAVSWLASNLKKNSSPSFKLTGKAQGLDKANAFL